MTARVNGRFVQGDPARPETALTHDDLNQAFDDCKAALRQGAPVATATTAGLVKPGANLALEADGTLDAPAPYTLPAATATRLGGIKVGENLSIAADGTLSAPAAAGGAPIATAGAVGTVKPGSGLTVSADGTLTLSATGSATLAGDTDVLVSAPADGDRLHFVAASSKWVNGREPYNVSGFVPGVPGNAQTLLVHKFAAAVRFPGNFASPASGGLSSLEALGAATGQVTVGFYRLPAASDPTVASNWVLVGAATVAAGAFAAVLTTVGGAALTFAQGDRLKALAPSSADLTFASPFLTLAGDR